MGMIDSTAIQAVLGRLVQRWEKVAPWIIVELERCSRANEDVLLQQGDRKRLILDRMEKAFRKREKDIEDQLLLLVEKGMLPGKEASNAKKGPNIHKS